MQIDHVAIAMRDIDASLPWYIDHLGLTLLTDEVLSTANVRLVYLDGGACMLQLVQPIGPCPVAEFLDAHGEGLHHVCLAVDDIPTTLRHLPGQDQVKVVPGGRQRRACFLAGVPNGLRVELTELAPFAGASAVPGGSTPS